MDRSFEILVSYAMHPSHRIKEIETFGGAKLARETVELLSEAMLMAQDDWSLEKYLEILSSIDKEINQL